MPTAHDLYLDILEFLARGTSPGSLEGPHDINNGVPVQPAPGWGSPTHLSHLSTGLLPTCALGKGERSAHAKLHAYLAGLIAANDQLKYFIISEFPLVKKGVGPAETIDLLVLDSTGDPIAAIELKHMSCHQANGPAYLLEPNNLARSSKRAAYTQTPKGVAFPPASSLDADYLKCSAASIHFPGFSTIGTPLPLIQVGLLTAIHSCTHSLATTTPPVNFVASYRGPYSPGSPASLALVARFAPSVNAWWSRTAPWLPSPTPPLAPPAAVNLTPPNQRYSDKHAKWGWGPEEAFSIPAAGVPAVTVTGRVGYVLVMTPADNDQCVNTPT